MKHGPAVSVTACVCVRVRLEKRKIQRSWVAGRPAWGGEPGPILHENQSSSRNLAHSGQSSPTSSPLLLFLRRLASPALAPPFSPRHSRCSSRGATTFSSSRVGRRLPTSRAVSHDSGAGAYLRQESSSNSEGSRGTHPGRAADPAAAHKGEGENGSQFVKKTPGTGQACLHGACEGAGPLRKSCGGGRRAPLSSVSGLPWLTPEPLAGLEILRRRRPRHPSNHQVLDPSAVAAPPPYGRRLRSLLFAFCVHHLRNLLALDPAGGDPCGI